MNQVELKSRILLTIKRIGINGEGIGYYKRQAIFVDGTIPGEVVEVEIVEVNDKYAVGVVTKMKTPSPARVEPKCPYFDKCGGCSLQHISYDMQLNEKLNMVIESFNRYYDGDVSKIKFHDPIGMENPWGYRNKTSLPLRHDGDKVVSGLYAKDSNKLVYVDKCLVENAVVQNKLKEILEYLTLSNADIYNPKTHTGIIRYVVVRGFTHNGETQVTFVLTKEDERTINIIKKIKTTSVNYTINSDVKSVEIFGKRTINVSGSEKIKGKINHLNFSISPSAFFQLNSKQTEVLYNKIVEVCDLDGTENVLDCYSGIGTIGMMVASKAKEVRGIDINRDGIKDANEFAKENGITNATFYAGNILPYLTQFKEKGFVPDVLIVDPPRKGLDLNLINYLQKNKLKKIVYVSCNPSTLVKNLNHLIKYYNVRSVHTIDMFPETANVETVVLLTHKTYQG